MNRRRLLLALGAGGVVTATLIGSVTCARLQSPDIRAERALDALARCTLEGDAACVWSYVPSEETGGGAWDERALARFLRDYVRPELAGYRIVGQGEVAQAQGWYTRNYRLGAAGRPEAEFSLTVADVEGEMKALYYVSRVVFAVCQVAVPTDPGWKNKIIARRLLVLLNRDKPELEATGLTSFVFFDGASPTKQRYGTWRDWYDYQDWVVNGGSPPPSTGGLR